MVRLVWGKMIKLILLNWQKEEETNQKVIQPTIAHKTLAHEEEKVALVLLFTGGFTM